MKMINYKNRKYYFFDDKISAKDFDADKIKIDENSHKNTFICHIGYMTVNRIFS